MKTNGFSAVLALLGCLFLAGCEDTPGFDYNAPENTSTTEETPIDGGNSSDTGPLTISVPNDITRGVDFLPETHDLQPTGANGKVDWLVTTEPQGIVTTSVNELGELSLAGVPGAVGETRITLKVSDKSDEIVVDFTVAVSPYQPKGELFSGLTWLQDDGEGSNLTRVYDLYLPNGEQTDLPLVILLHGAFGNKEGLHQLAQPEPDFFVDPPYRRWLQLADEEGIMLAFPNGLGIADSTDETETLFWNDCRGDVTRERDDIAFVQAIAGELNGMKAGVVDENNVFIMGISNGGMMAYRLAREAPESWRAVATAVANEPQGATGSEVCATPTSAEAPPMMSIFSTADTIVPYDGGIPGVEILESSADLSGVDPGLYPMILGRVVSANDSVAQWQSILDTAPDPLVTAYPDRVVEDGSQVTAYRYSNSSNGKELAVIIVDGGRHNLPSREFITPDSYRDQNNDIEAVDLVWDFFKRHSNQ